MDPSSQDGDHPIQSPGFSLSVSPEQVLLNLEDGQALSKEALVSGLRDAGVSVGIDEAAINEAVSLSQQGQAVVDTIIARHITPQACKPASLESLVTTGQAVLPGDVIQRLIPGDMGNNGTSVTGATIKAPPAPVVKLQQGNNTTEAGCELRATLYGVVNIEDGFAHVEPPLYISADKMSANLDIHPQSQNGVATTVENILDCLASQGLCSGLQADEIEGALTEAQSTATMVAQVPVAVGLSYRNAKPADYAFQFKINGQDPLTLLSGELAEETLTQPRILELVEEDSVLCLERPATTAESGINIFNEAVQPSASTKTTYKTPICGDNVVKEGNNFKTTVVHCGYADLCNGVLSVSSPVLLSENNLQATLCLYPDSTERNNLSKERVQRLLSLLGINFGVDEQAVVNALEAVQQKDVRQIRKVIGRGQEERQGEDARFEHFISVAQQAGTKKGDGTIDFHERGTIINVKPGEAIGKKIPPTSGQPRVNMLGETTPAKGGGDIDFQPGEHCELRDDGTFYATGEGALMIKENVVHITDIYQHQGDVDLQSGNLFHKKGAVEISGSVMSGFEVKANSHIMVKENVDNGKLVAGGDVAVGTGVIQPEDGEGHIHAMGNVSVKFALNAKILSYADINVGDSAMNSQLHAKGKIDVTKGKGCIIGGSVKSSQQIRAKQIGSEAGSLTHVEIEIDPRVRKSLSEAIAAEEELIKQQLGDVDKLNDLLHQHKTLFEKNREQAAIIIENTIYPGTTIKILNVVKAIKEEKSRCKITLTPNKKLYFGNIE